MDVFVLPRQTSDMENVRTIEGNPGVFMNQARFVSRMLTSDKNKARFIVTYRKPSDLVVSYYKFKRYDMRQMNAYFAQAVKAFQKCVSFNITRMPHIGHTEWDTFFECTYLHPTFVNAGMYAMAFIDYFRHGFSPDQFIMIKTKSISQTSTLSAIASFLKLSLLHATPCQHMNHQSSRSHTPTFLSSFFAPYEDVLWQQIAPRLNVV
jgi:hypothetical protein